MFSKSFKSNFLTTVGWIAIIGFIVIYITEFFPKHGPPITIKWIRETFGTTGLIIVNIVIVLAFFALLPLSGKSTSLFTNSTISPGRRLPLSKDKTNLIKADLREWKKH